MTRHHPLSPIGHALLSCGLLVACLPAWAQTATSATSATPATPQVAAPAAAAASAAPAAPAKESSAELAPVIVTAQKRSQNIKEVPIAISVVSGEQLEKQGLRSITDLSKTAASLEFGDPKTGGAGGSASIRGIGTAVFTSSAESSVGVVVDGVPQGSITSGSLFDLDRVEVLRGPQGTLFGKSASAGVINIVTVAPRIGVSEGFVTAELAGGQTHNALLRGAVNVPINDMSALRVTAHVDSLTGVYENVYNGERSATDSGGLRLRYLLKPNADLAVNLIAEHDVQRSSGAVFFAPAVAYARNTAGNHAPLAEFASCGVTVTRTNNKVCSDVPERARIQIDGGSAQFDLTLGGGTTLTSITALRQRKNGPDDSTSISMNLLPDKVTNENGYGDARQFTQEVRLASAPRQTVEWVAGAFYSDYDAFNSNTTFIYPSPYAPSPPVPRNITTRIDRTTSISSAALFGQAITKLTEQASVVAGLRYTRDKVSDEQQQVQNIVFAPFALPTEVRSSDATTTQSNLSGKLGLLYALDKGTNLYATVTRGYKAPQIDNGTPLAALPGAGTATGTIVKPEIPTTFELGAKASLLERRLDVDVALFRTNMKDFQEQNCTLSAVGALNCIPLNVPEVNLSGLELDLRARPIPGLTLNAGGALILGAEYPAGFMYDGQNVGGQRLLYSPKGKLILGAEYATSVFNGYEWSVGGDLTYKTAVRYCNTLAPECSFEANTILGLRTAMRSPDDRWGVMLFVRNLTDERVPSAIIYPLPGKGAGSGYAYLLSGNSFRSAGVTVDYRF